MMVNVQGRARVGTGGAPSPSTRHSPIESGYQHFRLERQGALLADKTLLYYDEMVRPFLRWLDGEGVRRFDDLNVGLMRTYRAQLAARPSQYGRPLQPKTIWSRTARSCASCAGRGVRATGSTSESWTWCRPGCR
jgi:hypothetical protein